MISYELENFLTRHSTKPLFEYKALQIIEWPNSLPEGVFLAGGAVRRMIMGETTSPDYDFFFSSLDALDNFQIFIISREFEETGKNDRCITYEKDNIKIQLIYFSYFDSPEDLLNSFDYTICQFVISNRTLHTGNFSLWDLGRKRLVVNKITFPVASLRRLLKYTNQGFYACNGCLTDLMMAISNDPSLKNQLEITYVD